MATTARAKTTGRLAWGAADLRKPVAAKTEWYVGFLLGFPLALPGPPWYLLAFAVFILAVPQILRRLYALPSPYPVAVVACVFAVALSSIISPDAYTISLSMGAGASMGFLFLLFGFGVRRLRELLNGYSVATSCLALAIIIGFLATRQYRNGVELFMDPALREWGAAVFPDWPNALSICLTVGFLIHATVFRRYALAGLNLTAALMTTSRMPLLGMVLAAGYVLAQKQGRLRAVLFAGVIGALLLAGLVTIMGDRRRDAWEYLLQRAGKTEDRQVLYTHLLHRIQERPLVGWGAVGAHVGGEGTFFSQYYRLSYHNSYLSTFCRGGLLAFVPFLYLIYPRLRLSNWRAGYNWLMLYFLLAALVQTVFKHPHHAMMYSALLLNRDALFESHKSEAEGTAPRALSWPGTRRTGSRAFPPRRPRWARPAGTETRK